MKQGRSKNAPLRWQDRCLAQQRDIMYDMPMTWKRKQRKLLLRNKRYRIGVLLLNGL